MGLKELSLYDAKTKVNKFLLTHVGIILVIDEILTGFHIQLDG